MSSLSFYCFISIFMFFQTSCWKLDVKFPFSSKTTKLWKWLFLHVGPVLSPSSPPSSPDTFPRFKVIYSHSNTMKLLYMFFILRSLVELNFFQKISEKKLFFSHFPVWTVWKLSGSTVHFRHVPPFLSH